MSDQEALIEAVVSPVRERDPFGRIQAAPEWHDLKADERLDAFDQAMVQRRIEANTDPVGLSGTAKAVLARLTR